MAVNPDYPERPYSRTETDLKLENLEQRIEGKLDKIIGELGNLRNEMGGELRNLRNEMGKLHNDINWLKTLSLGVIVPILLAVFGGLIAILVMKH